MCSSISPASSLRTTHLAASPTFSRLLPPSPTWPTGAAADISAAPASESSASSPRSPRPTRPLRALDELSLARQDLCAEAAGGGAGGGAARRLPSLPLYAPTRGQPHRPRGPSCTRGGAPVQRRSQPPLALALAERHRRRGDAGAGAGAAPHTRLFLEHNELDDETAHAFADALHSGAMESGRRLWLTGNPGITAAGRDALEAACSVRALHRDFLFID